MYTFAYVQDSSRGVSKQCAITQPVAGFTCCSLSGIHGNHKSVSDRFPTVNLTKQRNIHLLCSLCLTWTPWLACRARDLRFDANFFPFIYVRKRKTNRWYQISELYVGSLNFQWNALTTILLQVYVCWPPDSGVGENWYTYACVCICTHSWCTDVHHPHVHHPHEYIYAYQKADIHMYMYVHVHLCVDSTPTRSLSYLFVSSKWSTGHSCFFRHPFVVWYPIFHM